MNSVPTAAQYLSWAHDYANAELDGDVERHDRLALIGVRESWLPSENAECSGCEILTDLLTTGPNDGMMEAIHIGHPECGSTYFEMED